MRVSPQTLFSQFTNTFILILHKTETLVSQGRIQFNIRNNLGGWSYLDGYFNESYGSLVEKRSIDIYGLLNGAHG